MPPRLPYLAFLFGALPFALLSPLRATDLARGREIIVSEISYNPPSDLGPDDLYEFVEIHNRGAAAVDVSSWRLKDRDELHSCLIPEGILTLLEFLKGTTERDRGPKLADCAVHQRFA